MQPTSNWAVLCRDEIQLHWKKKKKPTNQAKKKKNLHREPAEESYFSSALVRLLCYKEPAKSCWMHRDSQQTAVKKREEHPYFQHLLLIARFPACDVMIGSPCSEGKQ